MSSGQIAAELAIEETSVETHAKRIVMKLQLRGRVQAVSYAYETRLTHPARGCTREPVRPTLVSVECRPMGRADQAPLARR